jgi:hypothetical protein
MKTGNLLERFRNQLFLFACFLFVMLGVSAQTTAQHVGLKRQQTHDEASAGTNLIRLVEGKAYHVLRSTNWVTLPRSYERGKFLELTDAGPAFEIEKTDAYHNWSFDRVIVITNCPTQYRATGERMQPLRVLPVGVSKHFSVAAAIYDHGVLPSATANSVTSTNSTPSKR